MTRWCEVKRTCKDQPKGWVITFAAIVIFYSFIYNQYDHFHFSVTMSYLSAFQFSHPPIMKTTPSSTGVCILSQMAKVPEKPLQDAIKSHSCNQCQYSSTRAYSLKVHMRKHSGEKPFKCNQCDYPCTSAGSLKRHIRIHSGENPLSCTQCDYSCKQAGSLRRHMLSKFRQGFDEHAR